MCGITGILNQNESIENRNALIKKMLLKTTHRGPDDNCSWSDNYVTLGHNRLKIIDLSESGKQPMHKDDLVITYNGEIYNYIELRQTLSRLGYEFTSQSDTEVILNAYRFWGEKCVDEFVGMWAFAIWDKAKKTLFCSRDRFGIKPFYYIHKNNAFYFSSEYKPLLETPAFDNRVNVTQFKRALLMGWLSYNEESFYETVNILPPAHNMVISGNVVRSYKYWELKRENQSNLTENEKNLVFYEMFKESLKIHLRSDVPYGGCLSGGIDSSSIASMISKEFNKEYKTFTIYYSNAMGVIDERPYIAKLTDRYKNITPYFYSPEEKEIEDSFEHALYQNDVPFTSSSYMSQYFVMKLAADNNIKVLVDGQGADEYLAGYFHTFYRAVAQNIRNFRIPDAYRVLSGQIKRQRYGAVNSTLLMSKSMLSNFFSEQSLYAGEYRMKAQAILNNGHAKEIPFNLPKVGQDKFHTFLHNLMFYTSLPTLLHYADRNSMTFSVESRVPYLDHRIVEFVYALPQTDKISAIGETKVINRRALAHILPAEIAQRTDKSAFDTPGESLWLKGKLKFLLDIDYDRFSCLDKKKVSSMVEEFKKGNNKQAKVLWKVGVFNHWLKKNDLSV